MKSTGHLDIPIYPVRWRDLRQHLNKWKVHKLWNHWSEINFHKQVPNDTNANKVFSLPSSVNYFRPSKTSQLVRQRLSRSLGMLGQSWTTHLCTYRCRRQSIKRKLRPIAPITAPVLKLICVWTRIVVCFRSSIVLAPTALSLPHLLLGCIFPAAAWLHKAAQWIKSTASDEISMNNTEFIYPSWEYESHFRFVNVQWNLFVCQLCVLLNSQTRRTKIGEFLKCLKLEQWKGLSFSTELLTVANNDAVDAH